MLHGQFQLPIWFDIAATFAFALTGGLAAMRRGYDIVGLFFLALATGVGGALIRDGVFIQQGPPPIVTDATYIEVVIAGALVALLLGERASRVQRLIAIIDAFGLGAYACFGVQKSLAAGLALPAAVLVGVINAAGGGLLRDVLVREEPLVFKPGQFYVLTALVGAVTFVFLGAWLDWSATRAAFASIALTFVFRALTITFNWRTAPAVSPLDPPRT
ncbi:MAG: TRIC cation channel family protein [Opitutae bacterium]|nr:TRIC cation channel family protein [Opitutae bacterium]